MLHYQRVILFQPQFLLNEPGLMDHFQAQSREVFSIHSSDMFQKTHMLFGFSQ